MMPNFLYVGPDKAGSTWLYEFLRYHPDVSVPDVKELLYFERYYHRNQSWYTSRFSSVQGRSIRAEVCHEYLYSEAALQRIKRDIPQCKLMVTLREPVNRAVSAYHEQKKAGLLTCSFEQAIAKKPGILERGYYSEYLQRLHETFDASNILLAVFDDLCKDSELFATQICQFLGITIVDLPRDLKTPVNTRRHPHSSSVSYLLKHLAKKLRDWKCEYLLGRLKRSSILEEMLYSQQIPDTSKVDRSIRKNLRRMYLDEIRELNQWVDRDMLQQWGYTDM